MNARLLAIIFRWIARILGSVLVGLVLFLAVGGGVPDPLTQPWAVLVGFLALAFTLLGILLAWRWEFPGGILSLAGWVQFIAVERVSLQHSIFFILLSLPGLLFLSSSLLCRQKGARP